MLAAKYGRGFVSCRNTSGQGWGAPGAVRIEGGSVGFQIGVSSTDLILLVMNERGMKRLLSSKFTLGGGCYRGRRSGGPQCHRADRRHDDRRDSLVVASHGVFAGVSLDGSTLRNDIDVNRDLYGKRWENKQILNSGLKPPAGRRQADRRAE